MQEPGKVALPTLLRATKHQSDGRLRRRDTGGAARTK